MVRSRSVAQVSRVQPVGFETTADAEAEVVVADDADEAGCGAQARRGIGEDGGGAARVGADELARPVERHLQARPHDLDQGLTDGDDLGQRALLPVASSTAARTR